MADRRGADTRNGEGGTTRNQTRNQNQEDQQQRPGWFRRAAEAVGIAGVAGVGAPTAATAVLTGAGFTSSGVAAGSIAAATQATIGNVAAGSTFAALQSIGATGGFAVLGPVGIGAAAVAAGGYGVYRYFKSGNGNGGGDDNPGPGPDTPDDKTKTPSSSDKKQQQPKKSAVGDDVRKSSKVKTENNRDSHSDASRRRDPEGSDGRPGPVPKTVRERCGDAARARNPERRSEFQEWIHQRNQNQEPQVQDPTMIATSTQSSSAPNNSGRRSTEEESMKPHLVKCNPTRTCGENSESPSVPDEEGESPPELQILEAIYFVLAFLCRLHEQRQALALLQNLGMIATPGPELVRVNIGNGNEGGNVQMNQQVSQQDFGLD